MTPSYSDQAEYIIFKLVRRRVWGHRIIREDCISTHPRLAPQLKPALQELVDAGLLRRKKGESIFTYSLNPHMNKLIMEIYERKKNDLMVK
jgi:hypothetical protein